MVRAAEDRKLLGVCASVSQFFGWEVKKVRIAAIVAALFMFGVPIIMAYCLTWFVMPEE